MNVSLTLALEQFVRTNKHLPGVPSADEFADTPPRPAQLQMALLEKVKELV